MRIGCVVFNTLQVHNPVVRLVFRPVDTFPDC